MEKKIEVVEIPISDLKDEIGNPRKCTTKKIRELQDSLEQFGDFGIIVVDEKNGSAGFSVN